MTTTARRTCAQHSRAQHSIANGAEKRAAQHSTALKRIRRGKKMCKVSSTETSALLSLIFGSHHLKDYYTIAGTRHERDSSVTCLSILLSRHWVRQRLSLVMIIPGGCKLRRRSMQCSTGTSIQLTHHEASSRPQLVVHVEKTRHKESAWSDSMIGAHPRSDRSAVA